MTVAEGIIGAIAIWITTSVGGSKDVVHDKAYVVVSEWLTTELYKVVPN